MVVVFSAGGVCYLKPELIRNYVCYNVGSGRIVSISECGAIFAFINGGITILSHTPLMKVCTANEPAGCDFDLLQRRHHDTKQQRDDRDHHQQFDKCKSFFSYA